MCIKAYNYLKDDCGIFISRHTDRTVLQTIAFFPPPPHTSLTYYARQAMYYNVGVRSVRVTIVAV